MQIFPNLLKRPINVVLTDVGRRSCEDPTTSRVTVLRAFFKSVPNRLKRVKNVAWQSAVGRVDLRQEVGDGSQDTDMQMNSVVRDDIETAGSYRIPSGLFLVDMLLETSQIWGKRLTLA